ncbi:MAG: type II toxin-antitoxin system VapC family toxin [Candidatus Binatia bacterium]
MVIDTSALLAILQGEPERRAFNLAIEAAGTRCMSTATFVEVSIVVGARSCHARSGGVAARGLGRVVSELAAANPLAGIEGVRRGRGRIVDPDAEAAAAWVI